MTLNLIYINALRFTSYYFYKWSIVCY